MKKKIELYLLVDHSASTTAFIDKINSSVKKMIEKLKEEHKFGELSGFDVDFVFIPFNHNFKIFGPTPIDNVEIADLEADGATDIGLPLIKAIQMANENYIKLKNDARVKPIHPIIFLFTDGGADAENGCTPEEQAKNDKWFEKAAEIIKENEGNRFSFAAFSFQNSEMNSEDYKKNITKIRELTNFNDRVIEILSNKDKENFNTDFLENSLMNIVIDTIPITGRHCCDCDDLLLNGKFIQ